MFRKDGQKFSRMPYNLAKILASNSSPNTPYTITYDWATVSLSLFGGWEGVTLTEKYIYFLFILIGG